MNSEDRRNRGGRSVRGPGEDRDRFPRGPGVDRPVTLGHRCGPLVTPDHVCIWSVQWRVE